MSDYGDFVFRWPTNYYAQNAGTDVDQLGDVVGVPVSKSVDRPMRVAKLSRTCHDRTKS